MVVAGSCHCRNVTFTLTWRDAPPAQIPARACGCTFCVKHGGLWTSSPAARLDARVADAALVHRYAFGTKTADFHVCTRCGVVPFVTSDIEGRRYAVVNVNAFEGIAPASLARSPADFDGEGTDARLARRARNWIPDVNICTDAPT